MRRQRTRSAYAIEAEEEVTIDIKKGFRDMHGTRAVVEVC